MNISDRCIDGHSTDKHIDEFKDLGINTPEQYKSHIDNVVNTGECFTAYSTEQTWRHADFFYHEQTNTMVVSPDNIKDEATAFRPEEGRELFDRKHRVAEVIENREIPVFHGIQELHPEPDKTPSISNVRMNKFQEATAGVKSGIESDKDNVSSQNQAQDFDLDDDIER